MKKLSTLLLLICTTTISFAQLVTPFTLRYSTTQKGGIRFLSNSIISCSGGCAGTAQVPPAGVAQNNAFTMTYLDVDGDASTFSSSSDSLALSTCSQISWVGLYWGANRNTIQANYASRFTVKLKANNGAYSSFTSLAGNRLDNTTSYTSYNAFADITNFVKAAGNNARFTVADMYAETGGANKFGGWTIVVVYKNDLEPTRNLTVFNGLGVVSGTNSVNIPISGFLTPLSGPVTFELGVVGYDGDRSQVGDQLQFNGGSGLVNISDALHPSNDVFNSTISYNGILTPYRLPSLNNTLGQDANIFIPDNSAKNYIGNSATSATITVTTGGETILQHVITSAIDVYEPDLRASVKVIDLNGGLVEPGDILEYTVLGKNIGSDPSVNSFITDTIEGNATYVPASLQILSGPNTGIKTDAAGDDQAEYIAAQRLIKVRVGTGANAGTGGSMLNSPAGIDSTVFTFRVQAATDCVVLGCDPLINNSARISGTGNVSGNSFSNESNPNIFDGNGCPVAGSTATAINTVACAPVAISGSTSVCEGAAITLNTPSSPQATYAWTGPASFNSGINNPSIPEATVANAGTYNVAINFTGLTCTISLSTNVVVNSGAQPGGLAGTAGAGAATETHLLTQSTYYNDVTCNLISRTQATGASPVTGNITSRTWIETTVPSLPGGPYVPRHYEILPAQNPTTVTGTVTLYFLQSEFDAFNNHPGSVLNLPSGPGDATGIANLRVGKYSGTTDNGTGLPGSYPGPNSMLDPPDAGIVWNATSSRWEVTFTVTGFGGFIIQTSPFVLPVTWLSFNVLKNGTSVQIQWVTSNEINVSGFTVQHSADGRQFNSIGSVAAAGNSGSVVTYNFTHTNPLADINFYRIEQTDVDGRKSYSSIRKILFKDNGDVFQVLVNPVMAGKLAVQFNKAVGIKILNAQGQVLLQQQVEAGSQTIDVSGLAKGFYFLQVGSDVKKFIIN